MTGGKSARWTDEKLSDELLARATAFVTAKRDAPFFLYYAVDEPHVPRAPAARFVGKSGMGPRGDAILQLDATVGSLVASLEKAGIADDTLILLSSDNGPILFDGYDDRAVELAGTHRPAGPFFSGKYAIYEGGTRVPMIACWPGHVRAGHVSPAVIDHVDILASLATLVGQALPHDAAVDSLDMLQPLLGRTDRGRDHVVEDAKLMVNTGSTVASGGNRILALQAGRWKFIRGSVPPQQFHGNQIGTKTTDQLYDLARDPMERSDLAARMPDRTRMMAAWLGRLEAAGRTRP